MPSFSGSNPRSGDLTGTLQLLAYLALAVAGLLLNDLVISAAVHLALGEPMLPRAFWWAPVVGMVLWAPVFVLLDRLRLGGRG